MIQFSCYFIFIKGLKYVQKQIFFIVSCCGIVTYSYCLRVNLMLPYDETLNNAPEIVIAGGFKIDIQGNAVPVEGYDNCSLNTLQGSFDTDKSNCIVLDRTRKKVPVLVHLSSGPVKEEWKIEHQVEKTKSGKNFIQTRMIRPDGNFVVPAS